MSLCAADRFGRGVLDELPAAASAENEGAVEVGAAVEPAGLTLLDLPLFLPRLELRTDMHLEVKRRLSTGGDSLRLRTL